MIYLIKIYILLTYLKYIITINIDDYSHVAENNSYSCDELTRWIGTEKHYSNDKKDILFRYITRNNDCIHQKIPVILLNHISYGWTTSGDKRSFFNSTIIESNKCRAGTDTNVVIFLSNYSINNNFSHFVHGLLRLFCALIDARWLQWNNQLNTFETRVNYTLWLDEYFKVSSVKRKWIETLGVNIRFLKDVNKGQCVFGQNVLYGSGCVRLLPPEKWFGYPGCRAGEVLPAFGHYMRKKFMGQSTKDLILIDEHSPHRLDPGLKIAFSVRDVTSKTGKRIISNLFELQKELKKSQHIRTSTENVTFEHLDVASTVRYMAAVHIFVSVHGAGMTNMFFMNRGSAVVEIIPFPLCNCRSPDYFYGIGGYYHGSAVAQGIRHYTYCVPKDDVTWHKVPDNLGEGDRCSWRHLHSVESVHVETTMFVSLMRLVERDLIANGMIQLTQPVIHMSPHANG